MAPNLSTCQASIKTPYKQFWPAQLEFMNCPRADVQRDVCVYQGGFGSGKTFIGSLLGIQISMKYPKMTGLVVGADLPLLKNTTIKAYLDHFDAFGWEPDREYRYLKTESKVIFPNGSEVLFRPLDNAERLKSLNVGWIHGEELSMASYADYRLLLSRLRHPGMPRKRFFGTTNPEAKKGWLVERFKTKAGLKEEIDPDTGATVRTLYRRIIAPTTENKALGYDYVASMKEDYDPDYYRIFVLGQDGDYTKGLMCKHFSDLNIREGSEYNPDLKIWLTCDFNVDPMSWALAHVYNGQVHFFDEIVLENTNINECVDEFVRRYPNHSEGVVITGDASGQNRDVATEKKNHSRYDLMRTRFGEFNYPNVRLDVGSANPNVETRILTWNANICNTDGVRKVFMHPRCKWLIYNCQNLMFEEGSTRLDLPTPHQIKQDRTQKYLGHIFDAASYLVIKEMPVRYEQKNKPKPTYRDMEFAA